MTVAAVADAAPPADEQARVNEILAQVFVSVHSAVAVIDVNGRLLMTNPAYERMLGYKPGELAGRLSMDTLAPESRAAAQQARAQQLLDNRDYVLPIVAVRRDGSTFDAEYTAVVIRSAQQQRYRVLTVRETAPPAPREQVRVAGKIKLVGLEAVKARLGERWPDIAARALDTAEHIIRQRLGPGETFSRTTDEGFVICFAGLDEEQAAFRAAMIGRAIQHRLIGTGDDPETAHVSTVVAPVTMPADLDQKPRAMTELLASKLDARFEEVRARARHTLERAIAEAKLQTDAVYGRTGRTRLASYARLSPNVGSRIHSAAAAMPPEEAAKLDLDAFLLRLAEAEATEEALQSGTLPILVGVSFEVFASRAATDRYLDVCRQIDPRLRQRLVLLLTDFPSGMPPTRLGDCVRLLSPLCVSVGREISDLEPERVESGLSPGAIIAVGAAASYAISAPTGVQLTRFLARLHAKRCKLLVHGVPNWPQAEQLRRLGVDLVSVEQARAADGSEQAWSGSGEARG